MKFDLQSYQLCCIYRKVVTKTSTASPLRNWQIQRLKKKKKEKEEMHLLKLLNFHLTSENRQEKFPLKMSIKIIRHSKYYKVFYVLKRIHLNTLRSFAFFNNNSVVTLQQIKNWAKLIFRLNFYKEDVKNTTN